MASGATNPFLEPIIPHALGMTSDTSSDGSWTPVSIVKRSLTRKRINNPSSQVGMQCMRGQDGKHYYIPIDAYNPAHLKIIEEVSPLLVNPTPSQFQKGALYTYIFASIITKDPGTGRDKTRVPLKLYACQAQNIFEFGTKHHHIFFRMALTDQLDNVARKKGIDVKQLQYALVASGEIKCITPRHLMVNFFSGTYKMQRKIKIPKIPKHRNSIPFEIDDMTKLMQRIDPNYTIEYNPAPFITSESVPITRSQLDFLESKGIPTFGFDTQTQCYDMRMHVMRAKNIDKRTVGFEEMQRKYEQITNPPPAPPPTDAYIMTSAQLKKYAVDNGLTVPEFPPGKEGYDSETKHAVRIFLQAHMDANKSKRPGGGKKRTMKQKMMFKKKRTLKK